MEITDVRVKVMQEDNERLLAFCSITLADEFVVRDIKIINGNNGLFVSMPSRKRIDHCPYCSHKNHLRARFCNDCGRRLDPNRAEHQLTRDGQIKLYADIAHPITKECRNILRQVILDAYDEEKELMKQPNYVCRYDSIEPSPP